MKKKFASAVLAISLVVLLAALFAVKNYLYARKPLDLTFDAAYYFSEDSSKSGVWAYEKSYSGHQYYLYLPPQYRTDNDDQSAKLPLIVAFHGSDEKGQAFKYGRIFTDEDFQQKIFPKGAAVLLIFSRINYFTDPHGTALLVKNVCIKNKCIDPTNIVGYGFSQGAKFVAEMACAEPELFRAVVSGSGFYQMTLKEILRVLPIQFYWANSEDDKGIFEQGMPTGRRVARFCKNSRYVQYQTRHHFYVELKDKSGRKNKDGSDETFMDWLCSVVNK